MIKRTQDVIVAAEGAAVVEISERAALIARLVALFEDETESDLIEHLLLERARAIGLDRLIGLVGEGEG